MTVQEKGRGGRCQVCNRKKGATNDANKLSFPECPSPTNQSRTVHHDTQREAPKFGGESTRMPRALGCATVRGLENDLPDRKLLPSRGESRIAKVLSTLSTWEFRTRMGCPTRIECQGEFATTFLSLSHLPCPFLSLPEGVSEMARLKRRAARRAGEGHLWRVMSSIQSLQTKVVILTRMGRYFWPVHMSRRV